MQKSLNIFFFIFFMEFNESPEEIKKEFDAKLLKLKESLDLIISIMENIKTKTDEWIN